MAVDVISNQAAPTPAHVLQSKSEIFSRFPDGLKTSGQHPPLDDKLRPFTSFPQEISGPTVWRTEEYLNDRSRWVHPFSADEIAELSKAADDYITARHSLTAISRSKFPLPTLSALLFRVRHDLLNGNGFIVFKGFPVAEWGLHKSAVAYMGLGTYLGYFVSQNGRGHVLGHVKDLGEDSTQIDKVRIYRTNARQFFHADDSDIVGLLCCAKALEGGESDIVSSHLVWNTLIKENPDVAKILTEPIWYFDRKGEVSQNEEPYIKTSVFYLETAAADGQNTPRVYAKWDPYFVKSLTRFSDKGTIPPLSPEQQKAAAVLEETCARLALHMVLDVGDIQFLSNAHVFHARTAYKDYAPHTGKPRRHLMRLWLSTPEEEGGWKLPFHDSSEKKRGGIQVDDTAAVCPLDAE